MTDPSRTNEGPVSKFFSPIAQNVMTWVFTGILGYCGLMLSSISNQLSTYQTTQAVMVQRVDGIDRRLDSNEKLTDSNRMTLQGVVYQVNTLNESLKAYVVSGRPK